MQVKSDVVESSATTIARQIYEQQGITRSDICNADLSDIYHGLTTVYPPANIAQAGDMLARVDRSAGENCEPFWGVIVETRKHHALEAVISSVLEVCNIPVQLFHGARNREFIMSTSIAEMVENGKVVLTELDFQHLEARDYNGLMLYPGFWECMTGRSKILVFQTDSLCCGKSSYTLNDFSAFDYIGCNWDRRRPAGLIVDGGNGGFSLRDWSKSMKCLECFDPLLWPGGEDGYFAFHMELMGAHVATYEECGKFGTQRDFLDNSLGCHQVTLLERPQLEAFMTYCPEAKTVFPRAYLKLSDE